VTFVERFYLQIAALEGGEPLRAFDEFTADNLVMYDNDVVFAATKAEGRAKQLPFFEAALSISGRIEKVAMREGADDPTSGIAVFLNRSSFVTGHDKSVQIEGLVWQRWQDSAVIEERYYRDDLKAQKIEAGILSL
jgi:hypothetical protein